MKIIVNCMAVDGSIALVFIYLPIEDHDWSPFDIWI